MLCFLKIQLGDIHEKHNHNLVVHQVTYYNVFVYALDRIPCFHPNP